jgi:PAS domain S-box-containing protein
MTVMPAEERFRLITEASSEVFWICSVDWSEMFYVSPGYERIWGRSVASLYRDPKSFLEAIHPDDVARVVADLDVRHVGRPFDLEYRVVRSDGSVRWVWDHGYPVREVGGDVARYVGVVQDITDRKRAETELAAVAERFRLMCRATKDGIWDWDVVTNTAWWSEAYVDLFGYDHSVVPSFETWAERIHLADRERVTASFRVAAESGRSEWTEEYRWVMPDGSIRIVFDRAYLVHVDGRLVRIVGALMDVTQLRGLEAQLRQAQKMEAVGQLAGGIAHDFNNILQVISLELELLSKEPGLSPAVAAHAHEIRAGAERAASLTRQLLMFSRREPMQPRWLDLNASVADLARMLHRILGEDVTLELALTPGALRVHADPGMLHQVVINLAVNARDAMPRGGTLALATSSVEAIRPGAVRAGRYARIDVTDSGTGIAPDVVPHIFEPFFTTKEPGRGTGLGLATVFGIVEQHRGWLEFDTDVGRGTTFRCYLPLGDGVAPLALDQRGIEGGRSETILLVEDDSNVRRLVRAVLEGTGYRVLEADRGSAALKIWDAANGRVDLLFTDLVMPGGMDGRELASKLVARRPGLKVVFATGYSRDFIAHELGSNQVLLHKPVAADRLLAAVRTCLDG